MIQAAPLLSFLVVFGRKSQLFPFKKLGASIAVFRQKTSVDQRLARYRPMRLRHGCRHPAVIFGFGTGRWNISPGESRNFFGVISWKSCDSMWYLNIFDYMYWWVQRKIWILHLHKLIISQRNKHDFHWFSIWLWLNIELLQKMMLNHHLQSFLVSTPRYPKYN